jgi:hypothetical protein
MSKYRHPAPTKKLNTKPIAIFIAVSVLIDMHMRDCASGRDNAANG